MKSGGSASNVVEEQKRTDSMNKDENKIEEEFVNTIISNTVSFAR